MGHLELAEIIFLSSDTPYSNSLIVKRLSLNVENTLESALQLKINRCSSNTIIQIWTRAERGPELNYFPLFV